MHEDAAAPFCRASSRVFTPSGYGLDDELRARAVGIDDATDLLYEHRVRPRDVFWLAATSLDALVWGLHDWAHFHNHGPFDQPAMTELQCDLVALAVAAHESRPCRPAKTPMHGRESPRDLARALAVAVSSPRAGLCPSSTSRRSSRRRIRSERSRELALAGERARGPRVQRVRQVLRDAREESIGSGNAMMRGPRSSRFAM